MKPKARSGRICGFSKPKIDLMCPGMAGWETELAAIGSGSRCDCDNAVLRIGDPRTSLLSRGVRGLPAASTLVPARLGIDGALSMRHLCLWTCLLPTSLLPLPCSLPAPARVHSRCTAGSSPAISASRLVVVKMRSGFCRICPPTPHRCTYRYICFGAQNDT